MNKDIEIAISVLESQKKGLLEQVSKIDEMIKQMSLNSQLLNISSNRNINSDLNQNSPIQKNVSYTWEQKVANAIKHYNRFVHSKEITDFIVKTYNEEVTKQTSANISTALNKLKNNNSITKVLTDNNNRNTFWGSPKWLDNNIIIEQYKYDESYLFKKNVKKVIDI